MKKILVVDNDKDILEVIDLMLKSENFIIKTISQWQLILKSFKEFVPDLVLLDIDLEGADGSEICRKIKQSELGINVPIILISVHRMPYKYIEKCRAQGFLQKPFEDFHLQQIIQKNLN